MLHPGVARGQQVQETDLSFYERWIVHWIISILGEHKAESYKLYLEVHCEQRVLQEVASLSKNCMLPQYQMLCSQGN